MNDYSFFADLLDAYRSSPDLVKALWVFWLPATLCALAALRRRRPAASPALLPAEKGMTLHPHENGLLHARQPLIAGGQPAEAPPHNR